MGSRTEHVCFELSRVAFGEPWPSPRVGAALACVGSAVVGGRSCDNVCPKIDVAVGETPPPDGLVEPAGALVLIAGEGPEGPLDDVWMYEEKATYVRPPGVAEDAAGPWPSGWRLVGTLPGVVGGLVEPGMAQVGRVLWLFGGRTDAGPSADVFRIELETGFAERVAAVGERPPTRVSPAVAYDPGRDRFLIFGGLDERARGRTDLWTFSPSNGSWTRIAGGCSGSGCPVVTGREALRHDAWADEITVIADRGGPGATTVAWTLKDGVWETLPERLTGSAGWDCNADGAPETLAGARCGTGAGGFPDFGRMSCEGSALACRAPAAQGRIVGEYSMPRLRTVIAHDGRFLALRGDRAEAYPVLEDGTLGFPAVLRLRRAGHDMAEAFGALLVADGAGLSIYGIDDGALLASVETCGRARRVFVDGSFAYVVGLRALSILDVTRPSAPVELARIRLSPTRDGLALGSASSCSDCRGLDDLCDAMGACGAFGRAAAAYSDGRLFLNLLGMLYVVDLRAEPAPRVVGAVPVGLLTDMRAEGRFVYGNGPGRATVVVAQSADGTWSQVGSHDIRRWVEGTAQTGEWVARWHPRGLQIATRQ